MAGRGAGCRPEPELEPELERQRRAAVSGLGTGLLTLKSGRSVLERVERPMMMLLLAKLVVRGWSVLLCVLAMPPPDALRHDQPRNLADLVTILSTPRPEFSACAALTVAGGAPCPPAPRGVRPPAPPSLPQPNSPPAPAPLVNKGWRVLPAINPALPLPTGGAPPPPRGGEPPKAAMRGRPRALLCGGL